MYERGREEREAFVLEHIHELLVLRMDHVDSGSVVMAHEEVPGPQLLHPYLLFGIAIARLAPVGEAIGHVEAQERLLGLPQIGEGAVLVHPLPVLEVWLMVEFQDLLRPGDLGDNEAELCKKVLRLLHEHAHEPYHHDLAVLGVAGA